MRVGEGALIGGIDLSLARKLGPEQYPPNPSVGRVTPNRCRTEAPEMAIPRDTRLWEGRSSSAPSHSGKVANPACSSH